MKPIVIASLLLYAALPAAAGTGTTDDNAGPEGWLAGPSRASVLLIETIDTAIGEALSRLDIAYDSYLGGDFSALDLGGYRHVFMGFDGGIIEEASIVHVAAFAEGGGYLHLYGGSCDYDYAVAVNDHLVQNNTAQYCWAQPAVSPDATIANAGHYLTAGLPTTFDFVNAGASYYQMRILGTDVAVAARNGDGVPLLAARPLGAGRFDVCINSPAEAWYADYTDLARLTLIVANMLSVETAAPSVLLLETYDTHVDASLDALGVGYDQQLNGDFSLIDLSGYRQVFLALDGGPLGAPAIANLAGFAAAGGALHVLGGSAYAPYVTAMNDMLLGCDTGNYSWSISPTSPQFSVVDPGHYLTRNLTSTHDFGNVSATYYQLRITDPAAEVAAVNSAGAIQLAAKPHGDGRLDICTNSPTQSYYAGDDVIWAATVVRNMLDAVAPMLRSVADVPNDQGRQVRLTWDRSLNDDPGAATPIVDYAVYRLIDPSRGDAVAADLGTRYPPGSWEFLSAVPANAEGTYSIIAPTLGDDSVDDGPYYSHFFVRARTDTPAVYEDSRPVAGMSVDNLAPHVPTGLAVFYGDANVLTWHPSLDADFRYFKVYRCDVGGPYGFMVATTNTSWVDATGDHQNSYAVTAVDFAGNESEPAFPGGLTDADDAPVLRTALRRNAPNPFNPVTTIRYELARTGRVDLVVLDVSGREVRRLIDGATIPAGRRTAVWDGRDASGRDAAAGLYFYRLTTEDFSGTGRMMLVK
jgi:hypothetical protein